MHSDYTIETFFRFKQFEMLNSRSGMKISTDSVILGCWCDISGVESALDAGSGTGILCLMLAQRGVKKILGVEIDYDAYTESERNIILNRRSSIISVINESVENLNDGIYDLIISNPPYFDIVRSSIESPDLQRRTARHETTLSYEWLLREGQKYLHDENSKICFISPIEREQEIIFYTALHHLYPRRRCFVRSKPDKPLSRVLWDIRLTPGECINEELMIHDNNGDFTTEYKNLTKDFYVKF